MELQKVQVTLNAMVENSVIAIDGLLHQKKRFQFSIVRFRPDVYYVSADNSPSVAVEGAIIIAPPLQTQTIRTKDTCTLYTAKRLFMNIDINNGESIDFYYEFPIVLPVEAEVKMCSLIDQLFEVSDPFEKNILCNQIAQALFSCARKREQPFHPKLIQALLFIRKHYTDRLTVRDIALENQVSESSLYSLFRKYCRCTPVAYLNQCRLDAAAQLLLITDRTVAEISTDVGFENYSYFSKCFKRSFQVSPSQYRRAINP